MRLKLGCCITHGGGTIKIGFIGPGKVGVNLARYFTYKGIKLSGFYGRNINSTIEAANITKSKFYDNIQNIVKESDILFITTPDDIISIIDRELSKLDINNKSICHTSGSLKSNVLCNCQNSGTLIYSIHPIFAFSNKNINLKDLEEIYFSIEGTNLDNSSLNNNINDKNIPIINIIKTLGNKYFIRNKETSSIYHLANVFVSNLTLSLLDIGTSYLIKLGLNEKEALNAIHPLVQGNIENIVKSGFVNSLTGPVSRGDATTIERHLSVLEKDDKDLYKILSLNLLKLVALKETNNIENSKNDNEIKNAINNLLNNSQKHLEIYNILGGLD
jgi:predicted short-subunit dehydrogenase-like oxidoreductase (DUF2520 family)